MKADLALQVAGQLMAKNALGAHARDELGLSATLSARPVQAALASAASFAMGAALPVAVAALATQSVGPWIFGSSLAFLAALGVAAAKVGGAPALSGAWRVTFWGALAMAITAGAGKLFETVI